MAKYTITLEDKYDPPELLISWISDPEIPDGAAMEDLSTAQQLGVMVKGLTGDIMQDSITRARSPEAPDPVYEPTTLPTVDENGVPIPGPLKLVRNDDGLGDE